MPDGWPLTSRMQSSSPWLPEKRVCFLPDTVCHDCIHRCRRNDRSAATSVKFKLGAPARGPGRAPGQPRWAGPRPRRSTESELEPPGERRAAGPLPQPSHWPPPAAAPVAATRPTDSSGTVAAAQGPRPADAAAVSKPESESLGLASWCHSRHHHPKMTRMPVSPRMTRMLSRSEPTLESESESCRAASDSPASQ
jgi:hypothetical protein